MLNYIWAGMILLGVIYGVCTGQMSALTGGALDSAREAVSLCITMLGILSLWSGVLKIGERSGLLNKFSRGLRPFIRFLFPQIPDGHPASEAMSTNIIANMLGLGWAATPAGLKAMEQLDRLNPQKGTATNAMCTFLILNMSSLQLIPINMIAYRSQYGSINPAAIVMPALLATAVSTAVGILAAKLLERIWP